MTDPNLLVELFVEELPPKALKKLGDTFAARLAASLEKEGLLAAGSQPTAYASPRRLAAHLRAVRAVAPDRPLAQKLMPANVGLDAAGRPTPALLKKLAALGVPAEAVERVVAGLRRVPDGKTEVLFHDSLVRGATLAEGLQRALEAALAALPIPKVMSYQLADGWRTVHFVRPAHALVALHGEAVVPVSVLGLAAGRCTHGHRFEASRDPLSIAHADAYAETLRRDGAVIADFAERRAEIVRQLAEAAARAGADLKPIEDEALLDEVTALVERPKVLIGRFEAEFLAVPQECLILTMKANQKYFPLLGRDGKLSNVFLIVSNIAPDDATAVVGGNERVVRPRLADAKFFFDQDRKKSLEARLPGLAKVVYHNKLGSQGERVQRVAAIARAIADRLPGGTLRNAAEQAALLAKADLLTDMVGEFPELQGIMGRYYALHDGLPLEVADAIEDHYKPRFAGDALPRGRVGIVAALADKLETLSGLFGIGQVPTGDKDPFALRRHALGVIRMLIEADLPLELPDLLDLAARPFAGLEAWQPATAVLADFLYERLAGSLREQGYSAQEIEAVLALRPPCLRDIPKRLAAVRAFSALPEAAALAAANKRVSNLLKKAGGTPPPQVDAGRLADAAEIALHAALNTVLPRVEAALAAGDYNGALTTLAALQAPVDAFFEQVLVNVDDPATRANRLGLLASLHAAMNRIADLSRLSA
jgi:glycyl-tRNA synthetase beta chain